MQPTATPTERAKTELCGISILRAADARAEAVAFVRFGSGDEGPAPKGSLSVEVGHRRAAERWLGHMQQIFQAPGRIEEISGKKGVVFKATATCNSADVLRRLGLISRSGHAVQGIPPHIVTGEDYIAESVWRAAFLTAGSLSDPTKPASLELVCPNAAVALAMVGFARRLNVAAKTRETRGQTRVVIRDPDAIAALLARLGAHATRMEWLEQMREHNAVAAPSRLANFDNANLRRSAQAAAAAAAKVEQALHILGDDVPEHLAEAGLLRISHRHASLEELGRLAEPPMTKDAVAGRIRRLISMAQRRQEELAAEEDQA